MTHLPPHTFGVGRLHEALRAVLGRDDWTIRDEKPVLIGRYWAPKPDIAVLRGGDVIDAVRHPRPRDIPVLVEVSDQGRCDGDPRGAPHGVTRPAAGDSAAGRVPCNGDTRSITAT